MNLHNFYTHPAYNTQPEIDALSNHVDGSVLFVGNYCSAAIAPKFPGSFAAVPDQDVLFFCQTDNDADIKYAGTQLRNLPYPDGSFDTVIAAYLGVHRQEEILAELVRVSKQALLIIEADPSSEYVQILDSIQPRPVMSPDALIDMLEGFSIMEETVESVYTFADEEDFCTYFQTEFRAHEGLDIDLELIRPQYQKTVGERSVLFVCSR